MAIFCISSPGRSLRRHLRLAACLAGAVLVSPPAGMAQSAGPFAGMAGKWQGNGQVIGTNGTSERIKCRATYSVSPSGADLSQSLVCASDSYRFDIRSNVVSDGRNVQGTWEETTRNATGNLVGRIQDGTIESTVSGLGFTAQLSLRTIGRKQEVRIASQGSDVARVDISMVR